MEPTLPVGSLAIVEQVPADEVEPGDVVTFNTPGDAGSITTHRIASAHRDGSRTVYRTRGDANTTNDPWQLTQRGTMGELVLDIPYAGYLTTWLGQAAVRTAAIILASLIALLILLRRIWREEPAERRSAHTAVEGAS
jgi:signal peptidase